MRITVDSLLCQFQEASTNLKLHLRDLRWLETLLRLPNMTWLVPAPQVPCQL
jgi:hypothetical protein